MRGVSSRNKRGVLNSEPARALLIATLSGGLFWLVWLYATALRHPRYLDGWLLAGGLAVQLAFHAAIKAAALSPRALVRWRTLHVYGGWLLVAAFLSHSSAKLPDSAFEWSLWTCFILVTLSGIFGTCLARSQRTHGGTTTVTSQDRLPERRVELARDAEAIAASLDTAPAVIGLPAPHDAWIKDLYTSELRDYFQAPRITGRLSGSQSLRGRLTGEIDSLSRYVGNDGQDKLERLKALVIEKDRLDGARVHHVLTKAWLFVHVPLTYALVVLAFLHIVVVYAFSLRG